MGDAGAALTPKMHRRAFLASIAGLAGCKAAEVTGTVEARSSQPLEAPRSYAEVLAAVKEKRAAAVAASNPERMGARTVKRAQRAVLDAIIADLFPAWLGTRWAFHGTATEPGAPEGIACGYFVATILQHAGLRLSSRRRFGQATALKIQRALTPSPKQLHRIFSVPTETLERRIRALGEGLYLIGLDIHVGFVVVRNRRVRFVHASYTGDKVVTDEPLVSAEAIHASRKAGYFVTPLFEDERLLHAWLTGDVIPAPA